MKNFDSVDIFMIMLNIGKHYLIDQNICFNFMKDLNLLSNIYSNEEDLINDCNEIFQPLNNAIIKGDEESVIEISYSSKILDSNIGIIYARQLVTIFTESNNGEDSDDDKKKVREDFHQLMCSWTQNTVAK